LATQQKNPDTSILCRITQTGARIRLPVGRRDRWAHSSKPSRSFMVTPPRAVVIRPMLSKSCSAPVTPARRTPIIKAMNSCVSSISSTANTDCRPGDVAIGPARWIPPNSGRADASVCIDPDLAGRALGSPRCHGAPPACRRDRRVRFRGWRRPSFWLSTP